VQVRRVIVFGSVFSLLIGLVCLRLAEAATVADLLGQARQAQGQVRSLKSGSTDNKLRAVEILGPVVLGLVGASDLSQAAQSQRATVREVYELLNDPLEDIYDGAFSHINAMQKSIMDQDGDLEALYETREWKDAQTVASQSLYFLNWLRFIGSFVADTQKRKELLQKASDGFSEFTGGQRWTPLKRESLFGRALCEKELRQFDWAVRDLELLLEDPALPSDMDRKVRSTLADAKARRSSKGAAQEDEQVPPPPSPDDLAKAYLQKAQSLFDQSQKETGEKREKTRLEARAYIEEVKKKWETWKERAEAVEKAELTPEEVVAIEEEKNPFLPWKDAMEHLRKNEYAQAVPLLREVLASNDPRATARRRDALYYLGVGLFQQKEYRDAIARLDDFFGNDGVPPRYGPDAAYLRFKASEALYSRSATEETTKLYLGATKDLLRRYPNHKSAFEAYFRLGEYEQSHENYLVAADYYQKVTGDLPFRVRADYAALQSYFSLVDALEEKKPISISEKDLWQRIASGLQSFWKNSTAIDQNPSQAQQVPLREYRGRVIFLNTIFLAQNMDANAGAIMNLLQDFEKKYPEQEKAFESVARTRLIALQKTGRFAELEKNVDTIFARYNPAQQQELLKGLPQVLASDVKRLEKQEDKDNLLIARRTLARLYADRLQRGDAFAPEESPDQFKYNLAQLYLDVKDYDKASQLYLELRKGGAYSLAALAGLARIAEVKGELPQATTYWEELLKGSQVGDPLWFHGTHGIAQIQAKQGSQDQACKTISAAFVMIKRVADPGLKKKIQDLSVQTCKK
jgi:tetratricopeptide (TPR) repeat protein